MTVREFLKKFPALDSKVAALDSPVVCIMSHEGWDWQIEKVQHDIQNNRYVVKIALGAR